MRRLIVDCQILQTPAYNRGMGKYTLSLLAALLAGNGEEPYYDQIQLVFSHNLEKSEERMGSIRRNLKNVECVFLDLPTDISTELHEKYERAQATLSNFIEDTDHKMDHTDFLVMAPFFVGFPTAFPSNDSVRKFSIVYDLIPQKIWHLQQIFPDDVYFNHYKLFLEADRLFSISTAVKDDLINLVGIAKEKITAIDGGPFMPVDGKTSENVWKPEHEFYILMPSAPIIHKNNQRAVKGFAKFNKTQKNKYTLYITSSFDNEARIKIQKHSPKVEFTGNISDDSLGEAYKGASAVLFPSLTEGLGMPVLEAAQYNVPVACSDIPVLRELSEKAFYMFDPNNVQDIAKAIGNAVYRRAWQSHVRAYDNLKSKYTWKRSAGLLFSGITETHKHKFQQTKKLQLVLPRPNHDTAAGCLGEFLYSTIKQSYDVALKFSSDGITNRASYVAYLEQKATNSPKLNIANKRRGLLDFKRKRFPILLQYKEERKMNQLIVYAKRTYKDKALKLAGWEYTNGNGGALSSENLMELIVRKETSSK